MKYLVILLAVMVTSCQSASNHGHAHDSEGNHMGSSEEVPREDVTIWTEKTELFVEFPVLVVGETSRFAAHFTILDQHQAVTEGKVTVSLIKGKNGIRQTVEAPDSPGIFKPTLQPKEPGVYQLVFDLITPEVTDRVIVQDVVVYATLDEAQQNVTEESPSNEITFLKEQAWKIDFQTYPVVEKEVYDVIQTYGIWKVAPQNAQTIVATASGTVKYHSEGLVAGQKVRKGDVLLTINSQGLTENNLEAEIREAQVNLEKLEAAYQRKQQLYNSKIIPKSELEKVEREYLIAKSQYETLKSNYSGSGKQIMAPFDGYIKSVLQENGAYVDQGDILITVSKQASSILETFVSIDDAEDLQTVHNIWYQPRTGIWSDLLSTEGELISVGKAVERDQPMLEVFGRINEMVTMPEGAYTPVHIQTGSQSTGKVIPVAALLEDYGKYSVIVQLSGESFERRPVVIGRTNGSEVEIIKGLSEGEIVVTKGAYQVKMASMSGQAPAHGHAH